MLPIFAGDGVDAVSVPCGGGVVDLANVDLDGFSLFATLLPGQFTLWHCSGSLTCLKHVDTKASDNLHIAFSPLGSHIAVLSRKTLTLYQVDFTPLPAPSPHGHGQGAANVLMNVKQSAIPNVGITLTQCRCIALPRSLGVTSNPSASRLLTTPTSVACVTRSHLILLDWRAAASAVIALHGYTLRGSDLKGAFVVPAVDGDLVLLCDTERVVGLLAGQDVFREGAGASFDASEVATAGALAEPCVKQRQMEEEDQQEEMSPVGSSPVVSALRGGRVHNFGVRGPEHQRGLEPVRSEALLLSEVEAEHLGGGGEVHESISPSPGTAHYPNIPHRRATMSGLPGDMRERYAGERGAVSGLAVSKTALSSGMSTSALLSTGSRDREQKELTHSVSESPVPLEPLSVTSHSHARQS
ncbi:hypothetical protein KIPB_012800, partial [Kipferlia bialata]|eukprot:g12800.t1